MPTLLTSTAITALQLKESASPGTPASGYGRLYYNTSNQLLVINDAGASVNITTLATGAIALTSQAIGDLIYASSTTQFGRVADVATGQVLTSGGIGVVPAWSATPTFTGTNVTGVPVATGVSGLGTGVATALAIAVGSAGAPVTFDGALGTPSSGTLTNATGLPVASGISGLGTGVATFLATPSSANLATAVTDETGSGLLVFGTSPTLVTPALGTPASGVMTNVTGLPVSTGISGLGTGVATALAVAVGSAGAFVTFNGALGTPSSGTLTNATGLPLAGVVATTNQIPYGAASVLTSGAGLTYSGSAFAVTGTGTFTGVLGSTGFGTHSFSANGTGANELLVRSQSSGTGNYAVLTVSGETAYATQARLMSFSSTYTGSVLGSFGGGSALIVDTVNGLSLGASHASGDIRLYSRNALALTLGASQAATFAQGVISQKTSGIAFDAALASAIPNGTVSIRLASLFSGTTYYGGGIKGGFNSVGSTGILVLQTWAHATTPVDVLTLEGTAATFTGAVTMSNYGAGTATFDASGNITSVSDERYKDRIAPLGYGLAEVLALSPVQHGYNDLSKLDRESLYGGFLAQDVQQVMPLAVNANPDGYLSLSDRPILGGVVNAIKELSARMDAAGL